EHVGGVVLLLLRLGQGQQWPLEPDAVGACEFAGEGETGAVEGEVALLVQEQPADAERNGGAALPAGREDGAPHRWSGAKGFTTKTQRTQRRQERDQRTAHWLRTSLLSSLCPLCLCGYFLVLTPTR